MSLRIADLFGIEVKKDMNERGEWVLLPPPPRVLAVLGDISARQERGAPGHGVKSQKRRSKRRRLRRRELFLQRQTWRAFHEEEKRRAQAAA